MCCFVLYDNKQRPGTGITYFILCILCHEIKQLTPEHNKINKTTLFLQIVKKFASKNNKNASKWSRVEICKEYKNPWKYNACDTEL